MGSFIIASFYFHNYYILFHINNSQTIQTYLVFLCCWHILLKKTLFQTWQRSPPLPKDTILDSIIMLSTEVNFYNFNQIPNLQIDSLHDSNVQLCTSAAPRLIFTDFIQNVKYFLYLPFTNLKTKTLLYSVYLLVKNNSIRKFDPIRIRIGIKYQWCFDLPWNIPCSKNSPGAYNAEAKLPKQKIFELTCWSSNVGSKVWNSISPVSFALPIVTGYTGSVFTAWTSILRWNRRLYNSGSLVMKLSSTQ